MLNRISKRNRIFNQVATESINFQSPLFMRELVMAFENHRESKTEDASGLGELISKLIKSHTNLFVTINFQYYTFAVDIPTVDKNNILVNNTIKPYIDGGKALSIIKNSNQLIKGSVNLVTAKVEGFWAEQHANIYLNLFAINKNYLSTEELAAIVLHEVGHLFTYYEFMSRSIRTSQLLAGLSKGLEGFPTIEERVTILTAVKNAANLKDLDVTELSKNGNVKAVELVVVSKIFEDTESELGWNVCDMSTWEFLADDFAARFGAGRSLITGLTKLHKSSGDINFRSTPAYLGMEAFKLLLTVATLAIPLSPLSIGLGVWLGALISVDGRGDGTYDQPAARFRRIRAQVVLALKDEDISKIDKVRYLDDLKAIDSVIKDVHDREQFYGIIWNFLSPKARRDNRHLQLQKELEELAVNDLFVKAAEFKLHSN